MRDADRAASCTAGWATAADSTSAGPTRLPATLSVSSDRPRMNQNPSSSIFGPIAVDPDVREPRPVGVEVAVAVLPEALRHPDPGLADDQLSDRAAHRVAVFIDHIGIHARHRPAEGARFDRLRS